MGSVGGSIGTVLVQGFGLAAWLAPLHLAWIAAPLLRGRRPVLVGLRVAGDLLLLIIAASLLQVAAPSFEVFGHAHSGGNVGLFFGELMRGMFSTPGSFLVGVTAIGLILIGRSSFSFIGFCEYVALLARRAVEQLRAGAERLRAAWVEAWRLRAERRNAAPAAPKIESPGADEAIIMQLADEGDEWIPVETGVPPLAISESLRSGLEARVGTDVLEASATPPPATADEPETPTMAPPATEKSTPSAVEATFADDPIIAHLAPFPGRGGEARAEAPPARKPPRSRASCTPKAPAPETVEPASPDGLPEPRIVDTKPHQVVSRASTLNGRPEGPSEFRLPSSELLEPPSDDAPELDRNVVLALSDLLEKTLSDYGVTGKVEEIHPGPTVTTYELAPAAGTKVSKVANLSDDLALGLSRKVRIIAPIPGKSRIGFELPNDERIPVNLRELIEDERFQKLGKKAPLPVVLGRDIVGAPFYADLASMPHVIVAGATGAGKSVGLNVMLSSLLFSRTPEELRLLMIDPKVVELAPFDGIPHLLLPVVTDMKQAATALRWAVDEMERRYQLFADAGTKNITTYNKWVDRVRAGEVAAPAVRRVAALDADGEPIELNVSKKGTDGVQLPDRLPYIVCVVDEFADLMMQQGKDVEASVARLAQKARAAGMHVVLATQRPSVDVITGMIKANFPSRVAFRVAQKVDSRTILDEMGAEVLLGRGDMLVKLNGSSETRRVQCPFVSEEEVSELTDYLREQGEPQYQEAILEEADADEPEERDEKVDSRFEEAVLIVRDTQRCSTSWLQRKMTIGYNRAAKIVEMMERKGYVGPANGARDREVFIPPG